MKSMLVLGTYTNPPYHPLAGVDEILKGLFGRDFKIRFTEDAGELKTLSPDTDLFISYYDVWRQSVPGADALERYVLEGGRMLALHNGIALQSDERLMKLLGGEFTHHPPQEVIRFYPAKGGLLDGCEAFAISEEPYQFASLAQDITPVLYYTYKGDSYLAGWTRVCGKGKSAYLAPGHTVETFRLKPYQDMILKTAAWLLA